MDYFLSEFNSISIQQWCATIFSLVYIYYAVRNESICFVFGLIGACFWAYESYYNLNLKYDAFLQVFYVFMSIYGIYIWAKGGENQSEKPVDFFGSKANILMISGGIVLTVGIFLIGQNYLETSRPFIDLLTSVFSILATFLLVYRYIDNWIYWIIVDLIYIYIFWMQGGYLLSIIMVIYTIMAVIGYLNWRKIYLDKV